MGIQLPYVH